jgi:Fe-Mn family superoxide dismutase
MDEAWYIVEQQIRERHAEAREAARIQALTQDPATTARRLNSVGITLSRLAKWVLGSSNALLSEALTHAGQRPTGDEPLESQREKGHHHALRGHPNAGPAVDVRQTLAPRMLRTATPNVPSGGAGMRYQLTPINTRPWLLNGLSLRLIESHYENHYGGALRRLNAITEQLESLDFDTTPGYVVNSLKREELIALNSTLLHELYFASMAFGDGRPTQMLAQALTRDFGSVDRWRSEFVAMAKGLAGGSGWVLLVYVPRDRRLINQYAGEHGQTTAGGIPILALDMYEHAYHIDFGANATAYIDTFQRNIDWVATQTRYEDALQVQAPRPLVQKEFGDLPGVGVEEVKAMLDSGEPVQIIDARPRSYISRQQDIMDGAVWRDPERVQDWIGDLSKSDPVVVFCAYGFHVGCKTAIALREAGFEAKYMKGGHSAWKAIGGRLKLYT